MCGIAAVVTKRSHGIESAAGFRSMLDLVAHRGPDGSGEWAGPIPGGGTVWLGHRRLAILDLSEAAAQPMWDRSRRYALTFNGEIYNYLELRRELREQGVEFRTTSDTEVLLEAYRAWGTDCLQRLNGMFAFAIWDARDGRLFAARDRFGEKPLLFASKPGFFALASEYKSLLALPQVSDVYDEMRLLRAAYKPGAGLDSERQTVFVDLEQLLPGEALELDVADFRPRIWRYYEVAAKVDDRRSEAQVFAEFRDLLEDAVRIRMRSDVPVGSCLSGGLDSSAVVCLARGLVGPDAEYHTFTGVFPGTYADEAVFADQVIAAAHTRSHKVAPTPERFVSEAGRFMWHNELPVGSSSQFGQWCVFELAKEHGVTVLLDGQGADELLGGYEQYFAAYVQSLRQTGQKERLSRELPMIRARYPQALPSTARSFRDRLPFRMRHFLANQLGKGSNLLFGLSADMAEGVQALNAPRQLEGSHPLASTLAQDSFGRGLTTLLRYGDRNSMAHSREVRLPFCDHRLAELALSLPPQMLMGEVQTKRLLRESMHGILPESIRTRWNKRGFLPPQDLWFGSAVFRNFVRDALASQSFRESPYWRAGFWDRMFSRLEAGELGLGWVVWQPFMIELWKREFLDVAKSRAAAEPARLSA